jgi:hypothetical protein
MQAVANVSIGAMFFMYGLTATFGYLTFYSECGWARAGAGASELLPSRTLGPSVSKGRCSLSV